MLEVSYRRRQHSGPSKVPYLVFYRINKALSERTIVIIVIPCVCRHKKSQELLNSEIRKARTVQILIGIPSVGIVPNEESNLLWKNYPLDILFYCWNTLIGVSLVRSFSGGIFLQGLEDFYLPFGLVLERPASASPLERLISPRDSVLWSI